MRTIESPSCSRYRLSPILPARGATLDADLDGTQGGSRELQQQVDGWFRTHSLDWREIYQRADVSAAIHQHRMQLALAWTDRLGLACGSRVLEVGCGAGLASAALAQRGLAVTATDMLPTMLGLARQQSLEADVASGVDLASSDAHTLAFASGTFDLVVSLGVLPWLHSPPQAVHEMMRVLRPGGYAILTVENVWRLASLLDPRLTPALRGARRFAHSMLSDAGLAGPRRGVWCKRHTPREFDVLLASVGLKWQAGTTFGFGPFTLFGRHVLPNRLGNVLNLHLQALADRQAPGLRWMGTDYLVVARKDVHH